MESSTKMDLGERKSRVILNWLHAMKMFEIWSTVMIEWNSRQPIANFVQRKNAFNSNPIHTLFFREVNEHGSFE